MSCQRFWLQSFGRIFTLFILMIAHLAEQFKTAPTIPEGSGDRRVGRAIRPRHENRAPSRDSVHMYLRFSKNIF